MEIYVVKRVDTIFSISNKFGISEDILRNINGLSSDNLVVGQALIVNTQREVLGEAVVNGYAYTNINRDILRQALPNLSTITIFGYGFTTQGDLIGIDDSEIISISYEYNVAPIMLLSTVTESGNFSTQHASVVMSNEEITNRLIDNVLSTIKQKGYVGVDIDFEFVAPEDKINFQNFIRAFTLRLNENGYSVNVDLAPKTSANQPGLLYESHDYNAIGKIANTVLLMTYEWGYTYGPPMAVAPINSVRRVLDYGLTEIKANKIFMGIPNYAYDWSLPFEKGVTAARTIGNEEALQMAFENSAMIDFDEQSQTPYFFYTAVDGIEHSVWFEDARSIKAKLSLISELGILGAGYWNIMRPFKQNWTVLNSLYNIKKIV